MASDILIYDDDADVRHLVSGILEDEGHSCRFAWDGDGALTALDQNRPGLVVLGARPHGSETKGLEILSLIRNAHPELPVVVVAAPDGPDMAAAVKGGAYDAIERPFGADRLALAARRALETSRLQREVRYLKAHAAHGEEMVGHSPAVSSLRCRITRMARTNSRVLIQGPCGAGKGLTAHLLHARSHRAEGPFVVFNPGAGPGSNPGEASSQNRIEEELFGSEDRTTGRRVPGALDEAHGGTLYIQEVASLPRETQGKLLRVLVEQKFVRLGGSRKVAVDVRIVSSSSRDLEREMRKGRFREDLYHRLNVVSLRVPGLAERRQDIPDLVEEFAKRIARISGLPAHRFSPEAIDVLRSYRWPGNVREL
ncbi:MAG: sigma-54-dependent transcriptional regulator, partial [Hyphomicrobiaceae bacterium]